MRKDAAGDVLPTPHGDELPGVHLPGVRGDVSRPQRRQPRVPVRALQLVLPEEHGEPRTVPITCAGMVYQYLVVG